MDQQPDTTSKSIIVGTTYGFAYQKIREKFHQDSPLLAARILYCIVKKSNSGINLDRVDSETLKHIDSQIQLNLQYSLNQLNVAQDTDLLEDQLQLDELENTKSLLNYDILYYSDASLNDTGIQILQRVLEITNLDDLILILGENPKSELRLADLITALSMEHEIKRAQSIEEYNSTEEFMYSITSEPRPYDLFLLVSYLFSNQLEKLYNELRQLTTLNEEHLRDQLLRIESEIERENNTVAELTAAEMQLSADDLIQNLRQQISENFSKQSFSINDLPIAVRIENIQKQIKKYNWLANFGRPWEPKGAIYFDGSNVNSMARIHGDGNEEYMLAKPFMVFLQGLHELRLCYSITRKEINRDGKTASYPVLTQVFPTKSLDSAKIEHAGPVIDLDLGGEYGKIPVMTRCLIGSTIDRIYKSREINLFNVTNFQQIFARQRVPAWAIERLLELMPPDEFELSTFEEYYARITREIADLDWCNYVLNHDAENKFCKKITDLEELRQLISKVNIWYEYYGKYNNESNLQPELQNFEYRYILKIIRDSQELSQQILPYLTEYSTSPESEFAILIKLLQSEKDGSNSETSELISKLNLLSSSSKISLDKIQESLTNEMLITSITITIELVCQLNAIIEEATLKPEFKYKYFNRR